VTVDDLLVLCFTYDGERLFDLESVRRIISGFAEKEKSVAVFNAGDFREHYSTAMQRDEREKRDLGRREFFWGEESFGGIRRPRDQRELEREREREREREMVLILVGK
jgi:hypothetical protein